MKRRNFLKFLGLAVIAPQIGVDMLSKVKAMPKSIHVRFDHSSTRFVLSFNSPGGFIPDAKTLHQAIYRGSPLVKLSRR